MEEFASLSTESKSLAVSISHQLQALLAAIGDQVFVAAQI
jgi:hypothetical protein